MSYLKITTDSLDSGMNLDRKLAEIRVLLDELAYWGQLRTGAENFLARGTGFNAPFSVQGLLDDGSAFWPDDNTVVTNDCGRVPGLPDGTVTLGNLREYLGL